MTESVRFGDRYHGEWTVVPDGGGQQTVGGHVQRRSEQSVEPTRSASDPAVGDRVPSGQEGGAQGASVRDRRTGARRYLRDRIRWAGHHLHVLGHPQLRLRGPGLLHRPLLLLPPHPGELVASSWRPSSPSSSPHRRSGCCCTPSSSAYLRLASPLIKVVATIGLLGRHPLPGHADLRQPGHPAGPGPGARAGARLPLPRRTGDAGPGHRLHLRRGDRGGRSRGAALHRRRPQGEGDGRLTGDDRSVGHQPDGHLGRRLGGQHLLRRPGRGARRPDHRARRRPTSPCSSRPRSPRWSPPSSGTCRSRSASHS